MLLSPAFELRSTLPMQVFDLDEFLDAVFRAFAADAALLHAAKRHDLSLYDGFVDADNAVFEPFGDAPAAVGVANCKSGWRRHRAISRAETPAARGAVLQGRLQSLHPAANALVRAP